MMPPHLFVDISSHGLGHLAQAAPILNALTTLRPDLRLTLRTGLPPERLQARIASPFAHLSGSSDFGFVMHDAIRIDRVASAKAYCNLHADWPQHVAEEAAMLRRLAPDLVLTDVAYLPLAGAAQAGIPALSMCSLNWADLFIHVFGDTPWAAAIHGQILAAYRSAASFLRLTPAMPMPDLPHTQTLPPVAALGRNRRQEFADRLGERPDERIVLIAFGGFDKNLNAGQWPRIPGVRWLVPQNWEMARTDMTALESLRMNFTDLLCSVDAVLTKPGYGTFTEATCNGTPVLYMRRDDWPEQDCLIEWLERNACCRAIDEAEVMRGNLDNALHALWAQTRPAAPWPDGAARTAEVIASYLP